MKIIETLIIAVAIVISVAILGTTYHEVETMRNDTKREIAEESRRLQEMSLVDEEKYLRTIEVNGSEILYWVNRRSHDKEERFYAYDSGVLKRIKVE